MTKKLLFVTTILFVIAFVAFAADVTGKWTYQQPGRGGGGGTPPAPSEITNGKITGDKIYFEVSRAGRQGGEPTVTKYEGSVSGDTLNLKITRPGRAGGDPPPPLEVVAKREKS